MNGPAPRMATGGQMKPASLQDFRARVDSLDGQACETDARKRGFALHVRPQGVEFKLAGSGNRRLERWQYVEQLLDRYNKKPSFNPGDYQDFSRNASYVLRVLRAIVE